MSFLIIPDDPNPIDFVARSHISFSHVRPKAVKTIHRTSFIVHPAMGLCQASTRLWRSLSACLVIYVIPLRYHPLDVQLLHSDQTVLTNDPAGETMAGITVSDRFPVTEPR